MEQLPHDYLERVYAGVLGKIIGVYLGRPFEQWSHDAITARFGEIRGYVHDQLGVPLVVSDDDISGTFTFVRAMEDYGDSLDLTPEQIGQSWLNYIIEDRTILWWGGMGNSSEHTAFLRLKSGVPAPTSGSIAMNGKIVAEQIGAQIFIDGWGMLFPNEPDRAADFARRAGSVSHDGEAIHGAQVVASMVAAAFSEPNVDSLIEIGLSQIPKESMIRQMADDVRGWRVQDGDWRRTLRRIHGKWGYDQFPGGCHMLPNHAIILLALTYGGGDFGESMMIVNTAGYDTDCNSANVGCLLAIAGGLGSIDAHRDWRGPVADRMYLPTADAGRVVSDAVTETYALVNMARRMRGEANLRPKGGAQFHFSLPGSVQGFESPLAEGGLRVSNAGGKLRLQVTDPSPGPAIAWTPTWLPEEVRTAGGYHTEASPRIYPGQVLMASLDAEPGTQAQVCLAARVIDASGHPSLLFSDQAKFDEEGHSEIVWKLDNIKVGVIEAIGLSISDSKPGEAIHVDRLSWNGSPRVQFVPASERLLRLPWVSAMHQVQTWGGELNLSHNVGVGQLLTGTREWRDYAVEAVLTPNLAEAFGVVVRSQGLRRYVAVELTRDHQLRVRLQWDESSEVLREAPCQMVFGRDYRFSVKVIRQELEVAVDDQEFTVGIPTGKLMDGGIAVLVQEGRVNVQELSVSAVV